MAVLPLGEAASDEDASTILIDGNLPEVASTLVESTLVDIDANGRLIIATPGGSDELTIASVGEGWNRISGTSDGNPFAAVDNEHLTNVGGLHASRLANACRRSVKHVASYPAVQPRAQRPADSRCDARGV